jgi:hypothetical protein
MQNKIILLKLGFKEDEKAAFTAPFLSKRIKKKKTINNGKD